MDLQTLFNEYIKHGIYLKGWSSKTLLVYRRAFSSFQQSLGDAMSSKDLFTKARLEAWIIWMRQREMSPAGCNIYIRAMNAFCSWLKEEGHLAAAI